MLKSPLFLLMSLVTLNNVYGQLSQYQGFVFDNETKKPIEFASVSVLGKDSSIVAGTVTDEKGKFQVKSSCAMLSLNNLLGKNCVVIIQLIV